LSADLGTITAGTVTGGIIRTAASGARVELDGLNATKQIAAYNAGGDQTFQVKDDGSGFWGILVGSVRPIVVSAAGAVTVNTEGLAANAANNIAATAGGSSTLNVAVGTLVEGIGSILVTGHDNAVMYSVTLSVAGTTFVGSGILGDGQSFSHSLSGVALNCGTGNKTISIVAAKTGGIGTISSTVLYTRGWEPKR
jgi:hypothetical protein